MRECVSLADTEALRTHLLAGPYPVRLVSVEAYPDEIHNFDARIGWHTYVVMGRYEDGSVCVEGFTDGPVNVKG